MTEPTPTPPQLPTFDNASPPAVNTGPFNTPPATPPLTPPPEWDGYVRNSLFALHGRMGRLSMQAAFMALIGWSMLLGLIIAIIAGVVGVFSVKSHGMHDPLGLGLGMLALGGLLVILVIAMVVYMNIFYVRRLHDLNRSGWWLLIPIPIAIAGNTVYFTQPPGAMIIYWSLCGLNMLFFFYLLFAPGTAGINRFGPPRHTPSHEKVWGWICVSLMLLELTFFGWIGVKMLQNKPVFPSTITPAASLPNPNAKFSAPYPFTAQALWQKILLITALPNGTVDDEQIEKAFDTTLRVVDIPIIGQTYLAKAGDDWYFSLNLSHISILGQNMQVFLFNWSDAPNAAETSPPTGMCINVNDIKPSLLAQGWTTNALDFTARISNKITYKKTALTNIEISYDPDTHCMTQLTMTVDQKGS